MLEPTTTGDFAQQDRFFIRQRLRLVGNQYEIYLPAGDGTKEGELVGFVQQKLAALKEDLRVYTGPDKTQELFRIKARQVFDPRARYKVTDAAGQHIGELGKDFARSLARSTWRIYSPEGQELAWAHERSFLRALIRRFIGLVPFVGEFLEVLPIRYHFDFYAGDKPIGWLVRLFSVRDRYVLDLSGDEQRSIDRRVALALALGMDALQAR
jgi:uncharacterized protein YxjI